MSEQQAWDQFEAETVMLLAAELAKLPAMREEYENSPQAARYIARQLFRIGHNAGMIAGMERANEMVREARGHAK